MARANALNERSVGRLAAIRHRRRAALVAAYQPRVARDVGRDDGGKAALLGHSGNPAFRHPYSITPAQRATGAEPECFRRPQIDLQREFGRLHDRQIGGFGAVESCGGRRMTERAAHLAILLRPERRTRSVANPLVTPRKFRPSRRRFGRTHERALRGHFPISVPLSIGMSAISAARQASGLGAGETRPDDVSKNSAIYSCVRFDSCVGLRDDSGRVEDLKWRMEGGSAESG